MAWKAPLWRVPILETLILSRHHWGQVAFSARNCVTSKRVCSTKRNCVISIASFCAGAALVLQQCIINNNKEKFCQISNWHQFDIFLVGLLDIIVINLTIDSNINFFLSISRSKISRIMATANITECLTTSTDNIITSLACPECIAVPSVNQIYQCENGHTICIECYEVYQLEGAINCTKCKKKMFKTRYTDIVTNYILPRYK